jgi:hypothetical protein
MYLVITAWWQEHMVEENCLIDDEWKAEIEEGNGNQV